LPLVSNVADNGRTEVQLQGLHRALTRHHGVDSNPAAGHHTRRLSLAWVGHITWLSTSNEGQEAGTHWRECEQR